MQQVQYEKGKHLVIYSNAHQLFITRSIKASALAQSPFFQVPLSFHITLGILRDKVLCHKYNPTTQFNNELLVCFERRQTWAAKLCNLPS